jgi:hypothetical protein
MISGTPHRGIIIRDIFSPSKIPVGFKVEIKLVGFDSHT